MIRQIDMAELLEAAILISSSSALTVSGKLADCALLLATSV